MPVLRKRNESVKMIKLGKNEKLPQKGRRSLCFLWRKGLPCRCQRQRSLYSFFDSEAESYRLVHVSGCGQDIEHHKLELEFGEEEEHIFRKTYF